MPKRHSLCFVDDDPAELRRFRENLEPEFVIGTGQTLDQAVADLQKNGRARPDLFVLDLYFPDGPLNTEAELSELRAAWGRFSLAQAGFLSMLARLRQSSRGGMQLADTIRRRYRSRNYVFFTRKATLEEALTAVSRTQALGIMKKPDPHPSENVSPSEACDAAFRDRRQQIAAELSAHIRQASWWWKHRESVWSALIALCLGYAASVLTHVAPR